MLKCINSFSWFPWLVLLISLGRFYPYFGLLHSHFVIHNTSLCYATHTMLTCLCQDYELQLNKVCYSWKLYDERTKLWPASYVYTMIYVKFFFLFVAWGYTSWRLGQMIRIRTRFGVHARMQGSYVEQYFTSNFSPNLKVRPRPWW